MGIQCTVFGHVYDGTEFEEHRTERPRGEVLICREYQVCRRCGNRTEMYRNERLLTPRSESDDSQAGGSVGGSDPTTNAADDTPEAERENPEDEGEAPSDEGTDPGEDAPADTPRMEDATGTPSRASEVSIEGSEGGDRHSGTTAGADTTRDSVDDPTAEDTRTDDAVIITDGASDPESTATVVDRDGNRKTATPGGADPTPSFDHDSDHADDGNVACPACGQVWDRSTTSLREGDICPACGRGYVERQ